MSLGSEMSTSPSSTSLEVDDVLPGMEGVRGKGRSLVDRLDLHSLDVRVEIVPLPPSGKRMRVLFVDGGKERMAERPVD
jgi:hypothetical protein